MSDHDNHWRLDKSVSVTTIIAVVLMLFTGVGTYQALDRRITANEIRIDELQRQTLEYQRRAIDQMSRIEDKIDRVIERQAEERRPREAR